MSLEKIPNQSSPGVFNRQNHRAIVDAQIVVRTLVFGTIKIEAVEEAIAAFVDVPPNNVLARIVL